MPDSVVQLRTKEQATEETAAMSKEKRRKQEQKRKRRIDQRKELGRIKY